MVTRKQATLYALVAVALATGTLTATWFKIVSDIKSKTPHLSPKYTAFVWYHSFWFDRTNIITIAFQVSDKPVTDSQSATGDGAGIVMWRLRPWWSIVPFMA
jgi:hypothetical protein